MSLLAATPIVLDTSILLNFVNVGHVALLSRLDAPLVVLDQVLAEVIRPAQRDAVERAISAGTFHLESVTEIPEVTLFAELRAGGQLGAGECAVLAVALNRNLVAGLQDKRARAEGQQRYQALRLCRTEDLMLTLLRGGHITLDEADRLLVEWATKHRFKSQIVSFRQPT